MTNLLQQRARDAEPSLLERVIGAVRDVEEHLDMLPASPLLREMRARLHAYQAVVDIWAHRAPTELQVRTMLELVTELGERVRLRRPSATRPPPPPGEADKEWATGEQGSAVHKVTGDGARTDYLMTRNTVRALANAPSPKKIAATSTTRSNKPRTFR